MKQIQQNYQNGELILAEVPLPSVPRGRHLIKTAFSLISIGTEKMIIELGKKGYVGKALSKPELVQQVFDKISQEGFLTTFSKVKAKLSTPITLGYSCSGVVVETDGSSGLRTGDWVACGGAGFATHAEYNCVPSNLIVRVPESVSLSDAAFVTVGAIALQGVRQAQVSVGEIIGVIGLGLIGQLTVQILKAAGCIVIGSDPDSWKRDQAVHNGINVATAPSGFVALAEQITNHHGLDAVIITASTDNDEPIIHAGKACRMKGRIIAVGMVNLNVPRDIYYKKELDLRLSMAYGPGRYDPLYEEGGIDYPYAYVRWTEQRNFEAFLTLIAEKRITPSKLITHTFPFSKALEAYNVVTSSTGEPFLGVLLEYSERSSNEQSDSRIIIYDSKPAKDGAISVGLIGAGSFSFAVLLPVLGRLRKAHLAMVVTQGGLSSSHAARQYGFRIASTDVNQLLSDKEIKAVIISTRHGLHADLVIRALEAGKHVFVEKPLAMNRDELFKIKEALRENVILQVGFNRRFSPLLKYAAESLGSGPRIILYRVSAGTIAAGNWILDPKEGGGRIVGEMCHFIDVCNVLIGAGPVRVKAIRGRDSISQSVFTTLEYADGSIATIIYSNIGNNRMPKEYIEGFGLNSAFQLGNFKTLTIFAGSKKKLIRKFRQQKGFREELDAFLSSIESSVPAMTFQSIEDTTLATFAIEEALSSDGTANIR